MKSTSTANIDISPPLAAASSEKHLFAVRCIFLNRMRYLPEARSHSDKPRRISAVQNLNERLPELHVEGGVNDGIHGTIHVAQPSDGVIHLSRNLTSCAVGVQDMGNEKWQPAYDEDT